MYTFFTNQYLWNKLWQCLDDDGGHLQHLHWIQNSRTSLISILLLYKYSSYDYRVIFFTSKCLYIILGHSVYMTQWHSSYMGPWLQEQRWVLEHWQPMKRTFQINALIWFLTFSTCFKPHGFVINIEHTLPTARLLTKMHEKHTINKLHVQTVFLMMNPYGLRHLEDYPDWGFSMLFPQF
jgi:hypothetical protein